MGGASCLVIAPALHREDDDWLSGATAAADVMVEMIPIETGRPPAAVMADRFDIPWRAGPGALHDFARSGVFAHRVLGLSLPPGNREWAEFAAAFLGSFPAVTEDARPQILVFCGYEDVAAFRSQRVPISEVWWWGALGKLDTTIAAARELGDTADPVQIACLTEVCGFDLDFAQTLAREWNGSLDSVIHLASEAASESAASNELSSLRALPSNTGPPSRLRAEWEKGLIDSWDRYSPFVSPTALHPDSRSEVLRTRLWRGQLRELMPLVDEERARLEAWVRQGAISDPTVTFPIEIGYLAKLMFSDPEVRPRTNHLRRRAVGWLQSTRNLLAHRNILNHEEITEGLELLDQDRLGGRNAPTATQGQQSSVW